MIRSVLAPNPSPMTGDGTRTFLVGDWQIAIIDPGPNSDEHHDVLVEEVDGRDVSAILITHAHPDHDAGAIALAERVHAPIRAAAAESPRGGDPGSDGAEPLHDGDRIETDAGPLTAVATPGHTPDHFAFHAPNHAAVFCGDLMMGGMNTSLVAAPEGDLTDYLASLERVRALRPRIIYPAHGPDFDEPEAAIDAYVEHRHARELQVLEALRDLTADGSEEAVGPGVLASTVYGRDLHPTLRDFTRRTVVAYLEHLERAGRVRRVGEGWCLVGSAHGPELRA